MFDASDERAGTASQEIRMSNFVTPIPIHLDNIKALLPPGSTVDKLEWNPKTNSVDLLWHNGKLQTKYLWAWPFSLAQLEQKKLPDGVVADERNVLTATPCSPISKQREKLAGKLHKTKSTRRSDKSASHSAPDPAPVDGGEPATTGGVSTVSDGE